jgi:hypothetical protein
MSEAMIISLLLRGLYNSNWAVRERIWTIAERMKTDLDFLVEVESEGGWIEGIGRVMFRPSNARERAGFPFMEDLWKRAVIFGERPERYSPRNFSA